MRHRKSGRKFNRTSSHRKAMFRNMVTSLFKHDRIRTTDAKAKELRSWSDHLITLAKRGDLHSRRQAMAIIREKDVVHKLFEEAAERYGAVSGGYTRIVKVGKRPGDAATMSMVELISSERKAKGKKKTKVAKKAEPAKKTAATEKAEEKKAEPEDKKTEEKKAEPKAEKTAEKPAETKKASKPAAKKPAQKEAPLKEDKKEAAPKKAAPEKEAETTAKKEAKPAAKAKTKADTAEKKSD